MATPALAMLVGLLVVLFVVLALARSTSTQSPRNEEVLPSHYSSLLQFDARHYPGHCPECGTDNEPGYRICAECGGEIPTRDGTPNDVDIGWIVEG